MTTPQPGKYRHYKGQIYQVIGTAIYSENLQKMVVYRALYNSSEFGDQALWVRPLANFGEMVTFNGQQVPRFKLLEDH